MAVPDFKRDLPVNLKSETDHMLTFRRQSALCCAFMLGALGYGAPALAEDDVADATVEEITVIGTRSKERSASDLAVPVDVLDASELLRQGGSRMDDMLSRIVPSLNVSEEPISDGATFVRPMTLRGLPPDSTLVLLNGKRRHRSSFISLASVGATKGAHGSDVSSIPAIALDRVEVLRDGAAAQYGSDAIAGIVNLVMRDDAEGVHLETRYGQYSAGDGDNFTVAGNIGLPLTDSGFVNVSGEFNTSDPTNRSVQITSAAEQIAAGNTAIPDPAQIWGNPEVDGDLKLFVNSGFDLGEAQEVYAFGGAAKRTVTGGYYWRDPLNRNEVFTNGWPRWGDPEELLVVDHMPLDGMDCPTIEGFAGRRVDPGQLAAVENDPNCFVFNSVFPAGFRPLYTGDVQDASAAIGMRGEFGSIAYDVSAVYGRHQIDFTLDDTVNPQLARLEHDVPTSYELGGHFERDLTVNLDLTQSLEMAALQSPLNVAYGLEYRHEEFGTTPGELNSWVIDYINADGSDFDESSVDLYSLGCQDEAYIDFINKIDSGEILGRYRDELGIGSNGAPGFRPDPCGKDSSDRSTVAAYLDLEGQVSEQFLFGAATRYEKPQGFDANLDGKVSARVQVAEPFAVRGSAGTGFRVPTVGQETLRSINTVLSEGRLQDEFTVPATDPLLQGYARPLQSETSVNVSLGAVMNFGGLNITLDYYQIGIEDRISKVGPVPLDCLLLTTNGNIDSLGGCDDASLAQHASALGSYKDGLKSRIPNINSISSVSWFANDFDTTTNGIDLVATYPMDMMGGTTVFTFAANYNRTAVDRINNPDSPLVGSDEVDDANPPYQQLKVLEEGAPDIRASFTADHQAGPFRVLGRVRYYGDYVNVSAVDWNLESMDARTLVDVELMYNLTDNIALVAGVDNLFDADAGRVSEPYWIPEVGLGPDESSFGLKYPENAPFDINGTFYYLKAVLQM